MFVDTHGHINFNAYKDDADEVIQRAFDGGVAIIAPGSEIRTSRRAVEYAERYQSSMLWASVGLHPIHVNQEVKDETEAEGMYEGVIKPEEYERENYKELINSKKVVAVGEIGLDYWKTPETEEDGEEFKRKQAEVYKNQLDLSYEAGLPVINHIRVAFDDAYRILEEHPITKNPPTGGPGVIHSFTGKKKVLKKFLDLGYCIGITGIVFKLPWMPSVIKEAPLDKILLETDSPYLAPPKAESERNEPIYVKYIAEYIAELKGVSLEDVEKQTTENAQKLFNI